MATITVTSTADSGSGSLRQAIADAASGDTIVFDDSLEEGGVITIYLESRLSLTARNLTIDGGSHTGSGATLATRVILDAQQLDNVFTSSADNRYVLNNLTFKNGQSSTSGAGVYFTSSAAADCQFCVFNNCISESYGGGATLNNSRAKTVSLIDCSFVNCGAYGGGGVFIGYTANATITRCYFSANTSNTVGGGLGVSNDANATLDNCTFINNTAQSNGASAHFTNNTVITVNNCTFEHATATSGVNIGNAGTTVTFNGNNTASSLRFVANASATINGRFDVGSLDLSLGGAAVTFSGVDSILAVTTTATIGSATFAAAADSTGYAAFPSGTDTSAATFTGVKTAIYSTSTPTVSASIGETRTATVTIANAEAGYIAEVVYADGVVDDITIDDGSAVIAVDKAFKIRVFNGAFYESATVARTYYLKTYDADGDFATSTDWTLDAQKTLTCNAAPTVSGGVFYCTEPAEG